MEKTLYNSTTTVITTSTTSTTGKTDFVLALEYGVTPSTTLVFIRN